MIFGIGLDKTGTTTLGDAGEILGLKRLGYCEESFQLLKAWRAGDIDRLIEAAPRYDLLEDWPWPLVYRELAEAFPDSKFVLTRRQSTKVWLRSQQHHQKIHAMNLKIYGSKIYGIEKNEKDPLAKQGAFYEKHLVEVRAYFAGTDRLLEVCWEEGDGWDELCSFFGCPVPDVAFPHSNATPRLLSRRLKVRISKMIH